MKDPCASPEAVSGPRCTNPSNSSDFVVRYFAPRIRESSWLLPIQTGSRAVFGMAIFVFYRVSAHDFIYFQF